MTTLYEREMTITHKEFLRLLPKALNGLVYKKVENQITINGDKGSIRICLSPESTRKLGSLSLPMTNVDIELEGYSESDSVNFMSRFDLSYQKGGG